MQDSRAFVRAPPGDGFPEPWAHAGRHHGDPRLARHCVRGNRPVINLSGPIPNMWERISTPLPIRFGREPFGINASHSWNHAGGARFTVEMPAMYGSLIKCRGLRMTPKGTPTRRQRLR